MHLALLNSSVCTFEVGFCTYVIRYKVKYAGQDVEGTQNNCLNKTHDASNESSESNHNFSLK